MAAWALAALVAALYAQGWIRLRRRSGAAHATLPRAGMFALGLAASLAAVSGPLDRLADDKLLAAHMLQHLLLGDIGPLLLVLGVSGPLALFVLPPAILRPLARSPLRRLGSFLLRPAVSFGIWAAALVTWHVPVAYDAALAHPALHSVEHACFALGGVLAWTQIVDPARCRRLGPGGRALFALAMLAVSSILAEVLVATGPFYPWYAHISGRPFGWSAGQDQSHAAVLMMAEQVAVLGAAFAFLARAHVERVAAEVPGYAGRESRRRAA
jgi:putative membrane protein